MTEQPAISWEYFNSGDVFILELKNKIFVWIGKESNKMEKFQAGKVRAFDSNSRRYEYFDLLHSLFLIRLQH